MQRYIPIIKNEFINIKWLMLFMMFMIYIFGIRLYEINLSDNFDSYINNSTYQTLSILYPLIGVPNIIGIFILVYIQFKEENKEFFLSLPYTKGEIFITKLLCGVFSYSIVFIIYTVMIIPIYNKYSFLIEDIFSVTLINETIISRFSISNLIVSIFYIWLLFTAVYIVMVFFQTLFRSCIWGVFVGLLGIIFSINFMEILRNIIQYLFKSDSQEIFRKLNLLNLYTYIAPSYDSISYSIKEYSYGNVIYNDLTITGIYDIYIYLFIVLVFVLIFLVISFNLSKREEQLYNSDLILFKWAKICFIIFGGIGTAFMSAAFIISSFKSKILLIVIMLIFAIAGFFISKKIVDLTSFSKKRRLVK